MFPNPQIGECVEPGIGMTPDHNPLGGTSSRGPVTDFSPCKGADKI